MVRRRVIPCLLLKDRGLVKTVRFKEPKYVGDPINAIRIFNEKEVDELILLDIDASRLNQEPNYELIAEVAGEFYAYLLWGRYQDIGACGKNLFPRCRESFDQYRRSYGYFVDSKNCR